LTDGGRINLGVRQRKGLSPVIATVILSGVVLTIGGAVWSYALGASTVIAEIYVNDSLSLLDELTERFTFERVYNSSTGDTLSVWVYNYGDVNIVLDIYVIVNETSYEESFGNSIAAGSLAEIQIPFSSNPLQKGDGVVIKAYSRRQNSEYYSYYV
jgi:flagellin-like protein